MESALIRVKGRRQRGQAMVEYVVGLMVVYAILFEAEVWGGRNAVAVLTEAFQNNYQGYEYAQSQPTLD